MAADERFIVIGMVLKFGELAPIDKQETRGNVVKRRERGGIGALATPHAHDALTLHGQYSMRGRRRSSTGRARPGTERLRIASVIWGRKAATFVLTS